MGEGGKRKAQSRLLEKLRFGCIRHYPLPLCYASDRIGATLSCRKCSAVGRKKVKGRSKADRMRMPAGVRIEGDEQQRRGGKCFPLCLAHINMVTLAGRNMVTLAGRNMVTLTHIIEITLRVSCQVAPFALAIN
jgi:hypothetical protein